MYETNYHRASSVADAAKLIKKCDDGKLLSGGMTLIPTMKQRLASPSDLVDLAHIAAMKGVKVSGKKVTIGAATTHAEVASNEKLRGVCPSLADLASHIGDPHVRHRGTIGGSIANNDPAADYPSAMLALDATIVTDKRSIPADKFFKGLFETSLERRRNRHRHRVHRPGESRLLQVPQPRLALRHDRRVCGQAEGRRAGGGDGRGR